MRQSSTDFMNEMLKDNMPPEQGMTLDEQIAGIVDQKMKAAFAEYEKQMQLVTPPDPEPAPEPPEEPETELSDNSVDNEE